MALQAMAVLRRTSGKTGCLARRPLYSLGKAWSDFATDWILITVQF
jgi:hypothetical protein